MYVKQREARMHAVDQFSRKAVFFSPGKIWQRKSVVLGPTLRQTSGKALHEYIVIERLYHS